MPPLSQQLPVYSVEDLDHFRKITGLGDKEICPHMFIFDECSNLAGWYIAAFSCLYQQVLDNDLPFGGIPVAASYCSIPCIESVKSFKEQQGG